MMQAVNFCGMNDVANLKVQQEEEQKQLKVKMQKRKEQGKEEFRRASLVYMEEQSAMFEALAKKAADKRDNGEDVRSCGCGCTCACACDFFRLFDFEAFIYHFSRLIGSALLTRDSASS